MRSDRIRSRGLSDLCDFGVHWHIYVVYNVSMIHNSELFIGIAHSMEKLNKMLIINNIHDIIPRNKRTCCHPRSKNSLTPFSHMSFSCTSSAVASLPGGTWNEADQ